MTEAEDIQEIWDTVKRPKEGENTKDKGRKKHFQQNHRRKSPQLKEASGPDLVAHAFNPSTREAEAGGFLSSRPAWSTK
jgi:major histocompatibility complex class I